MGLRLSYSLADQEFNHTKSLGVWNVSTQLLGHLARHPALDRLTVFTNRTQNGLCGLGPAVVLEPHNSPILGRWGRIFWDQWGVYSAARRSGHPWLLLPKGFASFYRRCPVRLAAYVHDAMHDHYTHAYSSNPLEREAAYFLRSLRATVKSAEIIFTNTDFTRSEVQRLARKWNLPEPRVVTAGIGFDMFRHREAGNGDARCRIVIIVGQWPHKCAAQALEWMQRWVDGRHVSLGTDWIGALPPGIKFPSLPGWKHHKRLSQADYENMLGEAAALVYFSAYEGFGMPPVEGTLAGAAAVYSAIPAMVEAMNGCGYGFRNDCYEQFANAMDRALVTPPDRLNSWQEKLRVRHTWPVVADRILGEILQLQEQAVPPRRTISVPSVTVAGPTPARKLVVFAHVPPPHHGQSYMVKLMLDGFGGGRHEPPGQKRPEYGIQCIHIDARLSRQLEDIGDFRFKKVALLLRYCTLAIQYRFCHGVDTLYYVPAPGKLSALMRDWLVMALCRPFYKHLYFHWHASGLGEWVENQPSRVVRWTTHRLLDHADLSIVLSEYNRADAEKLRPKRICVVGNGIPDPCPDYKSVVFPRRLARLAARRKLANGEALTRGDLSEAGDDPQVFRILYLAHCTRGKGLFDTVEGVALAAERLKSAGSSIDLQLVVAGEFLNPQEEEEFHSRIRQSDLLSRDGKPRVQHIGFVTGDRKDGVFRQSDCFCFPTYYYAESFGLVVVEAMSFGLPVVTSRWRSIPELLPDACDTIVNPQSPEQIADALLRIMVSRSGLEERRRFERTYRLDTHLDRLALAFRSAVPAA